MHNLLKVAASYPGLEELCRLRSAWVSEHGGTPGRLLWRHLPPEAPHFVLSAGGKPTLAETVLPLCTIV